MLTTLRVAVLPRRFYENRMPLAWAGMLPELAGMLKLLCVTAHPDDEASSFGGTLLRCHDAGIETFVLCLTPGQAARQRGDAKSDDELAAMRRQEFDAACRVLEVTNGKVLDFPDGALAKTAFLDGVAAVTIAIRRVRPQVVATFGPEGGLTGHPDHGIAGLWTTAAFQWAGRADRFVEAGLAPHRAQKLYYATALFTIDGRPPTAPPPVTAAVDISPYLERKFNAFRRHKSQSPLFEVFEKNVSGRDRHEFFHLAASTTPRKMEMETDLFAGVVESP
jgi:LmbE family N-acetylglucosaminyl deacetylase